MGFRAQVESFTTGGVCSFTGWNDQNSRCLLVNGRSAARSRAEHRAIDRTTLRIFPLRLYPGSSIRGQNSRPKLLPIAKDKTGTVTRTVPAVEVKGVSAAQKLNFSPNSNSLGWFLVDVTWPPVARFTVVPGVLKLGVLVRL